MLLDMDEKTIKELVDKAAILLTPDQRYGLALKYIDKNLIAEWATHPGTATPEELATASAAAGFLAGIEFVLTNLEAHDDDPESPSTSDNRPYGN